MTLCAYGSYTMMSNYAHYKSDIKSLRRENDVLCYSVFVASLFIAIPGPRTYTHLLHAFLVSLVAWIGSVMHSRHSRMLRLSM